MQSRLGQRVTIQNIELGIRNSLGDIFLAHSSLGDALESLNGSLSTTADRSGGARQLDSEETGI